MELEAKQSNDWTALEITKDGMYAHVLLSSLLKSCSAPQVEGIKFINDNGYLECLTHPGTKHPQALNIYRFFMCIF